MSAFRQLSMKLANGEQASELLHAQAHIWNHIFNFINSMSLKCAIQLSIPDIIHNHGKPITLSELTAALSVHPTKAPNIHRLMRILVHSGFLDRQKITEKGDQEEEEEEEEGYVLTDASRLLLKDNPLSMSPFLLAMLDPILLKPWHYLTTWFQNEDPTPFDTAHGMTFWEYGGNEPRPGHLFDDAMASDARLVMSVVIDKCRGVFDGLGSLVDVGGGTGTVAKAVSDAFPNVECTVFDLPHVVADLQGKDNLKFLGGNMFEAVPPADAILLKWILHDWNDEECVKILKKCKEALITADNEKKGKVIIIDMLMEKQKEDEDESIETQLFFDMLMMALLTGKERNEKEWAKLFFDAGFSDYKITPVLGLRSLIEVFP